MKKSKENIHLTRGKFPNGSKIKGNVYIDCGDYLSGITSSGRRFKIDKSDYDLVKLFTWAFDGVYICTHDWRNNYKKLKLHRFLLNSPENKDIDHKNHDTLDCRRNNLRICEAWQNCANRSKQYKPNKYGHVGIAWKSSEGGYYEAYINVNKKSIYLGRSKNLEDAILLRKHAEKKYFGEFAAGGNYD